MGAGLVAVAAAVVILLTAGSTAPSTKAQPSPVAATTDEGDVSPSVSVSEHRYEPGHSSGWHVHPGMHSVVVLSGTLTVYDENCARREYGAGQSYLGGRQPHLARNEGDGAVELVATYVSPPSAADHGSGVSSPHGCRVP